MRLSQVVLSLSRFCREPSAGLDSREGLRFQSETWKERILQERLIVARYQMYLTYLVGGASTDDLASAQTPLFMSAISIIASVVNHERIVIFSVPYERLPQTKACSRHPLCLEVPLRLVALNSSRVESGA